MHTVGPAALTKSIRTMVDALEADPPRFIVDSQKMHFPYYAHPVFDLWPRLRITQNQGQPNRTTIDLRLQPRPVPGQLRYVSPKQMAALQPNLYRAVHQFTVAMLTNPKRKGGPLDPETADRRAQDEVARHQAMEPLRQFVMNNYQPVMRPNAELFIFEYRNPK